MTETINSARVFKNTIALYIRMLILTLISLFTTRIVLDVLGAEDYGLNNVVGGFVGMFGFLSGNLTISSQRYFALCLYDDSWGNLNKFFSMNFFIYMLFSVIVLVISETFGLWFVMYKLVIPAGRMTACIIVYEFSVSILLLNMVIAPFLALLVADENLSIYAIVSILEGTFKIIVAYLLFITKKDKLIVFSFLNFCISLMINLFYAVYCLRKYKKLRIGFYKDRDAYKEVFSFLNWNMIGAVAHVGKGQGVNIIMNLFFGPIVNAARGLAFSVNNAVLSFSQNFMKAVDPQITKTYASGNAGSFNKILQVASKMSFFLLYIIILPLVCNMNYVLTLWLHDVPDYTVVFTVLALIDAVIMSITDPIMTAVHATGKVKWYQIIVGGISLLNLPLAYLCLKINANPNYTFYVSIVLSVLMAIVRIIIISRLCDFSIKKYIHNVLIPICLVMSITIGFSVLFKNAQNFGSFLINVLAVVLFSAVCIILIGFNKSERLIVLKNLPILRKCIK